MRRCRMRTAGSKTRHENGDTHEEALVTEVAHSDTRTWTTAPPSGATVAITTPKPPIGVDDADRTPFTAMSRPANASFHRRTVTTGDGDGGPSESATREVECSNAVTAPEPPIGVDDADRTSLIDISIAASAPTPTSRTHATGEPPSAWVPSSRYRKQPQERESRVNRVRQS